VSAEIALIEPIVAARNLIGAFQVTHYFLLLTFLCNKQKLFDTFLIVDLEKSALRTWSLILDCPAVDLPKYKFKKFPGAIEITTMYTAHFNFELGDARS
jgi:hypothetical protein